MVATIWLANFLRIARIDFFFSPPLFLLLKPDDLHFSGKIYIFHFAALKLKIFISLFFFLPPLKK